MWKYINTDSDRSKVETIYDMSLNLESLWKKSNEILKRKSNEISSKKLLRKGNNR